MASFEVKEKGIAVILKKTAFPEDIKRSADDVYKTLDVGNHKSLKKLKIVCYCVYQAYCIAGEEPSIIDIGARLGLSPMDSRAAVNNRPRYKPGHSAYKPSTSEEDRVRSYVIQRCDFSVDEAEKVVTDYSALLANDPRLRTLQPQTVMAGFIMYWMPLNGYAMPESILVTDFGLSIGAIKSMCTEIKKSAAST
jgi:hypothetical protein